MLEEHLSTPFPPPHFCPRPRGTSTLGSWGPGICVGPGRDISSPCQHQVCQDSGHILWLFKLGGWDLGFLQAPETVGFVPWGKVSGMCLEQGRVGSRVLTGLVGASWGL